jgi:hypothetical protein
MCGVCDTGMLAGIMVCVLFLNCGEGVNMCRGHNVSTAGCQCSHRGGEGWGELAGNSGVTILCCLWSADVLTI